MKTRRSALAILVIVATTFLGIKSVHAELVFEEDLIGSGGEAAEQSVVQRAAESQSEASKLSTSQEREVLSRAEILRRHRMRAEMRNEDKLTERLEELRLKDEVKRIDEIVGAKKQETQAPVVANDSAALAVQPVGQIATPAQSQVVEKVVVVEAANNSNNKSEAKVESYSEKATDENKMLVGITPRAGLSGVLNSNFEVNSRHSFGVGLHVDVLNHFGFEMGYTRSQYDVAAGNAFGFGGFNPYMGLLGGFGLRTLTMNQNVFDIGPRVNILGRNSRIQPFISAGVGFYRSNIRLDQQTMNYISTFNPALAGDYTVSGFLGYVGGGAEVKITENIGITGMFRYYNVFSARESNPLASAAFVAQNSAGSMGYYGVSPAALTAGDPRAAASRSFGKAHFYTIQGGVTLSF